MYYIILYWDQKFDELSQWIKILSWIELKR